MKPKFVSIHRTYDFFTVSKINDVIFPLDNLDYHQHGHYWLVKQGKENVGFCAMHFLANTGEHDTVFLSRSGIYSKFRKHGIGKRLIRTRLKEAKKLGAKFAISYTIDNVASSNNLISQGFKLYIPEYRYGGDKALHWIKTLDSRC